MTSWTSNSGAHPVDVIAGSTDDDRAGSLEYGGVDDVAPVDDDGQRSLPGMRSRVHLADGTVHVVRITNRDYLAWDRTAPRYKWGQPSDRPFLFASFVAWSAARRDGQFPGDFDTFQAEVDLVEPIDADAQDDVRPTR